MKPHELFHLDRDVLESLDVNAGLVMLACLDGFIDAGNTGEIFTKHLLDNFDPQRLITFHADDLIDYRSRRPQMLFEHDRWTNAELPEIGLDILTTEDGYQFLFLHGAEPDLRWQAFAEAIAEILKRLNVELWIGVQGVPMGVPHTRPIGSTLHGNNEVLIGEQRSWFGKVKVPGSIQSFLEWYLDESALSAIGIISHVPHYLARADYPPAAQELLRRIESFMPVDLRVADLDERSSATMNNLSEQSDDSSEMREMVSELEAQYDSFVENLEAEVSLDLDDLPSAEELGQQVEQFLAQFNENGGSSED